MPRHCLTLRWRGAPSGSLRPRLAARAVTGGPTRLDNSLDRRPAAEARLAFAIIHAQRRVAIAVAASADASTIEHDANCSGQIVHLSWCESVRGSRRVDAGLPQRFGRVDVADSGRDALVEERGLHRRTSSRERRSQRLIEAGRRRIGAKVIERLRPSGEQRDRRERSRIDE
jgi:hypothetical protein